MATMLHEIKTITETRLDGSDWFRAECKCGAYRSGLHPNPEGARKAGNQHRKAKMPELENAPENAVGMGADEARLVIMAHLPAGTRTTQQQSWDERDVAHFLAQKLYGMGYRIVAVGRAARADLEAQTAAPPDSVDSVQETVDWFLKTVGGEAHRDPLKSPN